MSEVTIEVDALAMVIEAHWWPRGQVPSTPSEASYNIARLVIDAGYVRPTALNFAPFSTSDGVNFRRVNPPGASA